MYYLSRFASSVVALSLLGMIGCGSGTDPNPNAPIDGSDAPPVHADAHDESLGHSDQGPHGGHLIELGRNHAYHAELLEDDDSESVTVYILDADMQELAIDQEAIGLSLTAEGQTQAFELAATNGKPGVGASCFQSADTSLFQMLEHTEEIEGKLRVTIAGVPYVGSIAHLDHDDESAHAH